MTITLGDSTAKRRVSSSLGDRKVQFDLKPFDRNSADADVQFHEPFQGNKKSSSQFQKHFAEGMHFAEDGPGGRNSISADDLDAQLAAMDEDVDAAFDAAEKGVATPWLDDDKERWIGQIP